ncbi:PREDICTED: transmembrane protein 243 [Nipponia nippon]|nr:PREDICTED: transmembrane protein 243 [Nipponia nippon]
MPCAEAPVRRRGLRLAGEDLAQGVLVTISYGGGSLPAAAAATVPPWLGASELHPPVTQLQAQAPKLHQALGQGWCSYARACFALCLLLCVRVTVLSFLQDRVINLVVGGLTSLLLVVTLISAFVFPQLPPKPVNIFFAFCISLCCISAGILIYWYRQGDLEPKFRNLIYYILFSIVMLCICANLYFHEVGK